MVDERERREWRIRRWGLQTFIELVIAKWAGLSFMIALQTILHLILQESSPARIVCSHLVIEKGR